MAKTGAIETTLRRASVYAARAQAALGVFGPSAARQGLWGVADYTVSRSR